MEDFKTIFGRRLRHFMSVNDMTQEELAAKLGVSGASVSSWINGQKTPRMDKIDALCRLFNCRRDDFLQTAEPSYYLDAETAQKAQELFSDNDMRILFDAARGSRPEDLQMAADLLKRLKATNPNG